MVTSGRTVLSGRRIAKPDRPSGQTITCKLYSPHAPHYADPAARSRLPRLRGGSLRPRRRHLGRRHDHRADGWQDPAAYPAVGHRRARDRPGLRSWAKQVASGLAFGKTVSIWVRDTDRYGRTVADVILPDGGSLNHEMIRQGMAWWYREYAPHDRELARLETEAKAEHRGLWSQPGAAPPWEWRHGEGVPATAGVVGNRNSYVYHLPNCASVGRMSVRKRPRLPHKRRPRRLGMACGGLSVTHPESHDKDQLPVLHDHAGHRLSLSSREKNR